MHSNSSKFKPNVIFLTKYLQKVFISFKMLKMIDLVPITLRLKRGRGVMSGEEGERLGGGRGGAEGA